MQIANLPKENANSSNVEREELSREMNSVINSGRKTTIFGYLWRETELFQDIYQLSNK